MSLHHGSFVHTLHFTPQSACQVFLRFSYESNRLLQLAQIQRSVELDRKKDGSHPCHIVPTRAIVGVDKGWQYDYPTRTRPDPVRFCPSRSTLLSCFHLVISSIPRGSILDTRFASQARQRASNGSAMFRLDYLLSYLLVGLKVYVYLPLHYWFYSIPNNYPLLLLCKYKLLMALIYITNQIYCIVRITMNFCYCIKQYKLTHNSQLYYPHILLRTKI